MLRLASRRLVVSRVSTARFRWNHTVASDVTPVEKVVLDNVKVSVTGWVATWSGEAE